MRPLLGIFLLLSMLMGMMVTGLFTEEHNPGLGDYLFLGIGHLVLFAWAGVVVLWTRRHETWMNTSRRAWLIGMGLAYAVGLGTGVYVFVFG
jgi:hypothetical protein